MSLIGYTSGGSPIFFGGSKKPSGNNKGKVLYGCTKNSRHRLTKNQAAKNGYMCNHCGAPLKVRDNKIRELESLAKILGAKIVWQDKS